MAMVYGNTGNLRRANQWSSELKEVLQDELLGQNVVRWLSDFPDGDTLNIPSIGEGTVRNYTENAPVIYDALATGNFTFTLTDYIQSGTYITKKARQDAYYAAELEASFVPKQARAIREYVETAVLALAKGGASGGQTASDANNINDAAHRIVGSHTGVSTNERHVALGDIARALHALKKANVADQGLVGIVDPAQEYVFNTLANLVTPTSATGNGPIWGDLFQSGLGRGPRFVRNIYGFDIYVSNYLGQAATSGNESIGGTAVSDSNAGVCNFFFSAADQRNLPFVGAWRQMPEVDSEYNKDLQREEYVTTARFGLKVYRPENLVVILGSNLIA
jgi:hypothetical protein